MNNSQINERYYPKQPLLELTNARFNSEFSNGKNYKITIDDKIHIGSTYEELKTRLKGHLTNKNSTVYEYICKTATDIIKMEFIVNAPSADKKSLEAVENKHIWKRVLNKRCNPNKTKKIEYQVNIETKDELQERIKQLDTKFEIKENEKKKYYTIDKKVKK